jgi:hypothetical protein
MTPHLEKRICYLIGILSVAVPFITASLVGLVLAVVAIAVRMS